MKSKLILVCLLFSLAASAQDLAASFPRGKGSSFTLKMGEDAPPVKVGIYIASVDERNVNIEYYMESTTTLIPLQMWQQFKIEVTSGQPAKVSEGYVQTKEMKHSEKMTPEYLKGFDGVQVNDFLFATETELKKNKVGEETIEIPAGKTKTTHYRTTNNGQTVDYWISPNAKPIGLVKLVSKGPKSGQNYTMELVTLMNNVKAYINPAEAKPLSDIGKSYMAKPQSIR